MKGFQKGVDLAAVSKMMGILPWSWRRIPTTTTWREKRNKPFN